MKFPALATTTLTYLGNLVTPLSLIYIGAVLSKAGLQSIHFDRDTIAALLGKFILSPAIIVFVLYVATSFGTSLTPLLKQTLIVQAAVPALTILPILAAEAKGDVTYATNIVTTSTILFVLVIPFIMLLIS